MRRRGRPFGRRRNPSANCHGIAIVCTFQSKPHWILPSAASRIAWSCPARGVLEIEGIVKRRLRYGNELGNDLSELARILFAQAIEYFITVLTPLLRQRLDERARKPIARRWRFTVALAWFARPHHNPQSQGRSIETTSRSE